MATLKLRKVGSSVGVIIPKDMLDSLHLAEAALAGVGLDRGVDLRVRIGAAIEQPAIRATAVDRRRRAIGLGCRIEPCCVALHRRRLTIIAAARLYTTKQEQRPGQLLHPHRHGHAS